MATATTPCAAGDLIELARRARSGDTTARNELVERNLGLVKVIAIRFEGRGLDTPDLFQEGVTGLMRAAERFDPETHDNGFAAYAGVWIGRAIKQAIRHSGLVRLPEYLHRQGERPPRRVDNHLDGHGEADGNRLDTLPNPKAAGPSERIERAEASLALCAAIRKLPNREMAVVVWHFGLDGSPGRSAFEIGRELRLGTRAVIAAIDRGLELLRPDPRIASRVPTRQPSAYPDRCDPRRPRP